VITVLRGFSSSSVNQGFSLEDCTDLSTTVMLELLWSEVLCND
jgi:hypothetical protein